MSILYPASSQVMSAVRRRAGEYGMPQSTISTFFKHKEMIKVANVAIGSKVKGRQRPQIIEELKNYCLCLLMRNS